jgi:uncharacterized damage-inducible protein DinB
VLALTGFVEVVLSNEVDVFSGSKHESDAKEFDTRGVTVYARKRDGAPDMRSHGDGSERMAATLNDDLMATHEDLDAARSDLVATLSALTDDALERSRRGGWTVQRVLQHLIESEWHYAAIISRLRGLAAALPADEREHPASVADAARRLTASRRALLGALDGIDEATYYRLDTIGREEYSVVSVLENVVHHDREHASQLQTIVTTGAASM